ncbi:MAG: transposase [archaeon]
MNSYNLIPNSLLMFKSFFSKPQYIHLLSLMLGLIVAEKDKKNIQNISEITGTKSQSSLNRFLTTSKWNAMNLLCSFVALLAPSRRGGILILDDTKNEKSTDHTEGVSKLKDYVKGKFGFYHVMVSTLYVGFGRIMPMFLDLYMRETEASKMNMHFKTKIDIGIELLKMCLKFVTPKAIVFDSWYLKKPLIDSLPTNVKWVSRLKINWLVSYHAKELPAKLLFCLVPKERFRHTKIKFGKSRYRWVTSVWVNVNALGRVKLVLLKKRRNSVSGIILASNAKWNMYEIIALYKKRWAIEVFYRDAKQHLGLGDYQITKLNAIIRHLTAVSLNYGILKNIKLMPEHDKTESKQTIGEICRSMKSEYRIDKIVRESLEVYENVKDIDKVVSIMKSRISNL